MPPPGPSNSSTCAPGGRPDPYMQIPYLGLKFKRIWGAVRQWPVLGRGPYERAGGVQTITISKHSVIFQDKNQKGTEMTRIAISILVMALALTIATVPVIFAMVAEQKRRTADKAPPTPPLTQATKSCLLLSLAARPERAEDVPSLVPAISALGGGWARRRPANAPDRGARPGRGGLDRRSGHTDRKWSRCRCAGRGPRRRGGSGGVKHLRLQPRFEHGHVVPDERQRGCYPDHCLRQSHEPQWTEPVYFRRLRRPVGGELFRQTPSSSSPRPSWPPPAHLRRP